MDGPMKVQGPALHLFEQVFVNDQIDMENGVGVEESA
jgi:hypothetical protein